LTSDHQDEPKRQRERSENDEYRYRNQTGGSGSTVAFPSKTAATDEKGRRNNADQIGDQHRPKVSPQRIFS
jgi:hypothetical protein